MIRKIFFHMVVFATMLEGNPTQDRHAISYGFSNGRFGDNILSYVQARYISHLTATPFLYRPFKFSNQLILEYDARPFNQHTSKYPHQFHINSGPTLTEFLRQIRDPKTAPTLFIVDYFPAELNSYERSMNARGLFLNIPWHDTAFSNFLKKIVRPRISIPNFTKKDHLNVAVHVRTLSGGDKVLSLIAFPLKHPKSDYHKRQIERVYILNLKRPLYIFLFSDTNKPLELLKEFRQHFQGYDIEFGIQNLKDPDLNNTVQDFFAMQKFDVLIATQSSYSFMAARLGTFDMIILPVHYQEKYPKSWIDCVQIMSNKSAWFPYELNTILRDYQ